MILLALSIAAILSAFCGLFWHSFGPLFTPGPSDCVPDEARADPLKAHRWLKRQSGADAEAALRYVDGLYRAGAAYIRVTSRSDGLLIYLPQSRSRRQRLLAAVGQEERGQTVLTLTWTEEARP